MTRQLHKLRPAPLKRVLLVQDNPVRSSPILSLADELNRFGIETQIAGNALWSSTRRWLNLARRNQVIVFVVFPDGDSEFFRRQIHRAKLMGCLVVRWWVGSDVLYSRESDPAIGRAKALDEAVDLNIAVSPHLVTELEEIGIESEYVPSPCDLAMLEHSAPTKLPAGVLTYLPTKRRAFYGEKVLVAAIEANPDLTFYIVCDDSHALRHYPNVKSLGWVSDMESLWSEVGLLLRVTEHDGMPRMVLEALARSRYVIYSEMFDGCWYGRSTTQVQQHLERFKTLTEPNRAGPEVVSSIAGDTAARYMQKIIPLSTPALAAKRLVGTVLGAGWMR